MNCYSIDTSSLHSVNIDTILEMFKNKVDKEIVLKYKKYFIANKLLYFNNDKTTALYFVLAKDTGKEKTEYSYNKINHELKEDIRQIQGKNEVYVDIQNMFVFNYKKEFIVLSQRKWQHEITQAILTKLFEYERIAFVTTHNEPIDSVLGKQIQKLNIRSLKPNPIETHSIEFGTKLFEETQSDVITAILQNKHNKSVVPTELLKSLIAITLRGYGHTAIDYINDDGEIAGFDSANDIKTIKVPFSRKDIEKTFNFISKNYS